MRKPKILLISDVKNWGGYERAEKIKENLSDEFDFDIMDGDEFKSYEQDSNLYFVKWEQLNKYRHNTIWPKNTICLPEVLKWMQNQQKFKRQYDLYYLMFHTMITWQEVKRMVYAGDKFVSVVTGLPVVKEVFDNERGFPNGVVAFKVLANSCAAMFTNNMISMNELKKVYGGATFYTPRGVDPDLFYPFEDSYDVEKLKSGEHKFTVVFVGKDRSGKGLYRYIKPVCAEAGWELIVNERNYTDALPKDEMVKLYNQAHVYIVASNTDGTPNPALEAAACGRPIISNRIGNMPEFIENGYNGFLVKQKIESYIEKLNWIKENPEKAKEMGQNARQTVIEGWTWEHVTEWERIALRKIFGMDKG